MNRQPTSEDFLGPPPTHETLFAETFLSDNNQASTPTLTEAILEPDSFLVRILHCSFLKNRID